MIDTVDGARHLLCSHRVLRKGGRLVWLGSTAVQKHGLLAAVTSIAMTGALRLLPSGRSVPSCITVGELCEGDNGWYRNTLAELLDHVKSGDLSPAISERIPLAEARRAHELMEFGRHTGKIVLVTPAYSEFGGG